MPWDTDETRRRLQEAATAEFAAHGKDGTTMAKIAARAGINKERLYNYFGDKDALFAKVLADELGKLSDAVAPIDREDLGELAGRTYDYYARHPELARLLLWEGLSGETADLEGRTEKYAAKAQEYAARGGGLEPDLLGFLLIALGVWWIATPQLAAMLTGADADDPAEQARRRAFVVAAAERLAR